MDYFYYGGKMEKLGEKISIIVPVFNLEVYIEHTLMSILNQQYQNIEIVVVDDGSTDESLLKIKSVAQKDRRIKVIHQNNGGVTAARLKGVQNSSGEWIGFVDGDDEIDSDMYQRLLNNSYRYNADISHCGYRMKFVDERVHYFYNTRKIIEQDRLTGLKNLLDGDFIEPSLCNKLFRKNLFYNLLYDHVMPLDIKINEDLLMNYFLFSASRKSVYEDFCPYCYKVRQTSTTRSGINSGIKDPLRVREFIYQNCDDDIKITAEAALVKTYIYAYANLSLKNNDEKSKYRIRKAILEHWNVVKLLHRHLQWMAYLIKYAPMIFGKIYDIYNRVKRKSLYD